jgi:hypothetical protein
MEYYVPSLTGVIKADTAFELPVLFPEVISMIISSLGLARKE